MSLAVSSPVLTDALAAALASVREAAAAVTANGPAEASMRLGVGADTLRQAIQEERRGRAARSAADGLPYHHQLGAPTAVYRYERASEDLAFVVCRFEPKAFRPAQMKSGRWVWNLKNTPALLYRLPDVERALAAGETIWIVDGEKDVDALAACGVTATCSARSQGWTLEHAEQLTGARVRIVVDRDASGVGAEQARHVLATLLEAGACASSEVEFVQAAEGKDAADHLAAGLRLDEFEPIALDALPELAPAATSELGVVALEDFVSVEEPGAEPLVGEGDDVLVPVRGDVLIYGNGGAGKTTLTIDLAFHLSAGDDWLGITIAAPVRVLLVENEGPRPLYRKKLQRKKDSWTGSPLGGRLFVLSEPWTQMSFADPDCRQALANVIRRHEIDVLIVGPVSRSGMNEAGTLQEVRDFLALVDEVRTLAGRPVAVILVHHESKSGKVSGAWEGSGDTLLHVSAHGHGQTRLHVKKARWASARQGTTLPLVWTEGEGFAVAEGKSDLDDDTLVERILGAVAASPGSGWRRIEQETPGVGDKRRRSVRDRLLADGALVNLGKDENGADLLLDHCPARKTARLYLAGDKTICGLRPAAGSRRPQITAAEGADRETASAACGSPIEPQAVAAVDAHPDLNEVLDEKADAA